MKDRSNSIQVIERAARLLDGIASNGEIVSLKVLSAETGLHPSTAFRILGSLTAQGFVERTDNGCYRLGIKLLQLGSLVRTGLDVRRVAQPIMELLRDQVGETVNLTVREGEEVVYVERVAADRDASDADVIVLDHQLASREALNADERAHALRIDTTAAVDIAGMCALIRERQRA